MSGDENVVVAVCNNPQSAAVKHPATPLEAAVHPNEPFAPPTCAPSVPEKVMGADTPRDDVATGYTPAAPLDTKRLLEEGCVVVESPVHVIVELLPPTRAPRELYPMNGPEKVREVVATVERSAGVAVVVVQ